MIERKNNTSKDKLNRMEGLLAGQFLGDAYGAQFEFKGAELIKRAFGKDYRDMKASPVWQTAPGQITDDSEMAIALIDSISNAGKYDSDEASFHYVKWFRSYPFDFGSTTASALGAFSNKNEQSQANGALMRISPLAIYHARKIMIAENEESVPFKNKFSMKEADKDASADASITHPNLTCITANVLFIRALILAILGYDKDTIYTQIREEAMFQGDDNIRNAVIMSRHFEPIDMQGKSGWVVLALHNALYRLLHCESPEQAIRETAAMGGDTDTNCAIAGALVGAYYGFKSFPIDWVKTFNKCDTRKGSHPREYYQTRAQDITEIVFQIIQAAQPQQD